MLEGQEIEFWYIWDLDEPGTGMNAIVDHFNQENQWGITVVARDRGLVLDPLASVESEFEEGLIPHLMVSDSSTIGSWYQSGLIEDLTRFMEDPAAGMTQKEFAHEQHVQLGNVGRFKKTVLEKIRRVLNFSKKVEENTFSTR